MCVCSWWWVKWSWGIKWIIQLNHNIIICTRIWIDTSIEYYYVWESQQRRHALPTHVLPNTIICLWNYVCFFFCRIPFTKNSLGHSISSFFFTLIFNNIFMWKDSYQIHILCLLPSITLKIFFNILSNIIMIFYLHL